LIWIVTGVVVLLLAGVALALVRTGSAPARIRSRYGQTMMKIMSVDVTDRQLVIKGSFMGAMPTTTIVRPEEIWKVLGCVGIRVVLAMPVLLLIGWWRCVRPNSRARVGGSV
jgi:hypothetical protein